jgi:hypothetical protein
MVPRTLVRYPVESSEYAMVTAGAGAGAALVKVIAPGLCETVNCIVSSAMVREGVTMLYESSDPADAPRSVTGWSSLAPGRRLLKFVNATLTGAAPGVAKLYRMFGDATVSVSAGTRAAAAAGVGVCETPAAGT